MDPKALTNQVNAGDEDQYDAPDTLDYALSRSHRKPPGTPYVLYQCARRWLWASAIIVILLTASIWWHMLATMVLSLISTTVSFWMIFVLSTALKRNADLRFSESQRAPRGKAARTSVIYIIIAIVSSGLHFMSIRTFGEVARSITTTSVSKSQLVAIENGLFLYRDGGEAADTLSRLVESGLWTPQMLIAMIDPNDALLGSAPGDYSPYVFFPPADAFYESPRPAGIILAFERGRWHQTKPRVFAGTSRAVLIQYGVEFLNDTEFARALETDRQRRRELGWPVYEWDEASGDLRKLE